MKRAALLLGALVLAGCDGGGPQPGELEVSLSGPQLRAVVLRVTGPQVGIAPVEPGIQLHFEAAGSDTTLVVLVAARGTTLPAGAVARVTVPDVAAAAAYGVVVLDAAGPAYQVVSPAQIQGGIRR